MLYELPTSCLFSVNMKMVSRKPKVLKIALLLIIFAMTAKNADGTNRIDDRCDQSQPPTTRRPNSDLESKFTSEEEITGRRCFKLLVRPVRHPNSAHVAVIKDSSVDFCKGLTVKSVEFMALGFSMQRWRTKRIPIGGWSKISIAPETLICSPSPSVEPVNMYHTSQAATVVYTACENTDDAFRSMAKNTYRAQADSLDNGNDVVACAWWQYKPLYEMYPLNINTAQQYFVEFIAELDVHKGSDKMFRYVGKRNLNDEPLFKPPQDLKCDRGLPGIVGFGECQPISCIEAKFNGGLVKDIFTSFYDTVSDACRCYSENANNVTVKKYKYGGFHYGLDHLPPAPLPSEPIMVTDKLFNDCLQFYFNPETNCVVFTFKQCSASQVVEMSLEEIHIFALGSTSGTSSVALPFGIWEEVPALGNCGDIINKVKDANGNIIKDNAWSSLLAASKTVVKYEECDLTSTDRMFEGTVPKLVRVIAYSNPITLQGNGSVTPSAFAIRLNTEGDWNQVDPTSRNKYINFGLEAYTNLKPVGVPPSPGYGPKQMISMKTPIMDIQYKNENDSDSNSKLLIARIQPRTDRTHSRDYFQLRDSTHERLYYGKRCPKVVSQVRPVPGPVDPPRPLENACRCFYPKRSNKASSFQEFLTEVNQLKVLPARITESCFIIGFKDFGVCKKPENVHRLFLGFGLTCTGPDELEINDLVIQAINHMGYPMGKFEKMDALHDLNECETLLESSSGSSTWLVREFRPIDNYNCPETPPGDNQTYANQLTFAQKEKPNLAFFNEKLTRSSMNKGNYGFCTWWKYQNPEFPYLEPDHRNFYLDFQFIITANVEHRPTNTSYVITKRSESWGINVKECRIDKLNEPTRDIYMKNSYYEDVVKNESCLEPLSNLDNYDTGICGCFVEPIEKTHRNRFPPENDTRYSVSSSLQQCLKLEILLGDSRSNDFGLVVKFGFDDSDGCKDFLLYEAVFQAMNENGFPIGNWSTTLEVEGSCKVKDLKEAQLVTIKCPVNSEYMEYYKSNPENVDVLHFRNIWKDDEYLQGFCAFWSYPKEYAVANKGQPLKFPKSIQFYALAQAYHKKTGEFITAPRFSVKKAAFHENGKYTELSKTKEQDIKEFNVALFAGFKKQNVCIEYPPVPKYASYMCKMFHPRHLGLIGERIDLDDPFDEQAKPYRKAGCFSFNAYPGNQPLSMHLTFRQPDLVNETCRSARGVQFAVIAYNEDGYPISGLSEDSWTHYNNPNVPTDDPRYCEGEDIVVDMENLLPIDKSSCYFHPDTPLGFTHQTFGKFYKQMVSVSALPRMITFGTHANFPPNGVCFHWSYDPQTPPQETPKEIQFYLEFFVPDEPTNLDVGKVFLMRSKKFTMKYKAGDPIPDIPSPARKCHDETESKIFYPIPIPKDADDWRRKYEYNIYPNKESYRKCLRDYEFTKSCGTSVKLVRDTIVINPVIIIPGGVGYYNDDDENEHFLKTIYEGCIASKHCFSPIHDQAGVYENEPDCVVANNCEMVWAVGKQPITPDTFQLPDPGDNHIVLEIFANTSAWVAIGLSTDQEMGDDYVLECVREGSDVNLYNSWNTNIEEVRNNLRFIGPGDKAKLIQKKTTGNAVYCMFHLKKSFTITHPIAHTEHHFDLTEETYCVLSAYGEKMKTMRNQTGIGSHLDGKRKGHAVCRESVDLSIRLAPNRKQVLILQHHGALMTIGYMGFLSTSLFVARYYKTSITGTYKGVDTRVWIHAGCSVAGVAFVFLGWLTVYPGASGWETRLRSPFHMYVGYLSILITIINPFVGYYIRRTDIFHKRGSVYYMFHEFGGHFACVFGLFVIMLSSHVEYAFITCTTGITAKTWVVLYFVLHVVMSFNRYWVEKIVGAKSVGAIVFQPMVLLTQNGSGPAWFDENPKATKLRKNLLVIFFVLAWGFTIIVVVQIWLSDHSCMLERTGRRLAHVGT